MKPALKLGVSQQLSLTPQLRQAIRLLQLSAAELEIEIREALESNPLLEQDESGEDGDAEALPPEAAPADERASAANDRR